MEFFILVLCGKSCSGKTIIGKELEKMGYKKLITYTTRIKRENEINGESYHFISTLDFLEKLNNNFFVEFDWFKLKDGSIAYYGTSFEDVEKADEYTYVILTPKGIKSLKEASIICSSFFLNVSDKELMKRLIKRGDEKGEAERRFQRDIKDFTDVDKLLDFTVHNEYKSTKEVAEEIHFLYGIIEGWW